MEKTDKLFGLMKFRGGTSFERFKAFTGGNETQYDTILEKLQHSSEPRTMELLVDPGCNQHCAHCFLGQTRTRTRTPRETVKQVGTALLDQGYFLIPYPSEPLVSEAAFAAYTEFLSPYGDFLTNGTASLPQKSVKKLIQKLIVNNHKSILLSLHGATEETHEALTRTGDSFKSVLRMIEKLGPYVGHELSRVGLSVVVSKLNIPELDDICIIAIKNNVKLLSLLKLTPFYHTELPQRLIMDYQSTMDALLEISRLRLKYHGKLHIEMRPATWGPNFHNPGIWFYLYENLDLSTARHICPAFGWWLAVHPAKKELYPCMIASGLSELKIGELTDGTHIQYNALGKQLLKWHHNWIDNAKGPCAVDACQYSMICHGGCRTVALAGELQKGGVPDWFSPFPECPTQLLDVL
ncbi:MAG: SPASM domain-containing protein [Candidatus Hodarchaeota archaeon]